MKPWICDLLFFFSSDNGSIGILVNNLYEEILDYQLEEVVYSSKNRRSVFKQKRMVFQEASMHKKLAPEERKAQIIQTALKLFAAKGYENTTINSIIDEAGISKGGFYHHYGSKEELLEDIVRMLIGGMVAIFKEIDARDDLTALEKTNEYIRRVNAYKTEKVVATAAFLSELYSSGKNVRLESKIYDFAREHVSPIMKKIILQGVEEGTFKTKYPEEAAEAYVKLFIMHQQEMTDLFYEALRERNWEIVKTIQRKYGFFQKLLEDILGLEKGSLVVEEVMGRTAETMCEKIIGQESPGPD